MRSRLLKRPTPPPRLTITLVLAQSMVSQRKDSKGRPLAWFMGEEGDDTVGVVLAHKDLPFRMGDIELQKPFPPSTPFAESLNTVRKEWVFHYKLLRFEWTRDHYIATLFGIAAFCLGSISTELWSGGDAKVSGLDGVMAINGFQFFQVLLSVLCWAWFAYQAWVLFPVMRVHAISLLFMWNGLIGAQIFFHRSNPSFPMGFQLADMMEGTLFVLIVFFFLFFFWKAVVETRDLHVEVNHLHEDVRVMEAELAEHSLKGWSSMFGIWVLMVLISSWAGIHHVATYGESNIGFLVVHLMTGLPAIPLLMFILWYPQRMLGSQAQVRTRAAVAASMEMEGASDGPASQVAACPECKAPSKVQRSAKGELVHPCLSPGCSTLVTVGTKCATCKQDMPSRIECPACGVNAPALDYLPDQEAW